MLFALVIKLRYYIMAVKRTEIKRYVIWCVLFTLFYSYI